MPRMARGNGESHIHMVRILRGLFVALFFLLIFKVLGFCPFATSKITANPHINCIFASSYLRMLSYGALQGLKI